MDGVKRVPATWKAYAYEHGLTGRHARDWEIKELYEIIDRLRAEVEQLKSEVGKP